MRGPFGSLFWVHLGYHSSEGLVHSFDGAVGLWVVGQCPHLRNAQEVT